MTGVMNMQDGHLPSEHDDGDLARLLAATGPRNQPSAETTAAVRAAVEAEWRRSVAAVAVWMARPLYLPAAGPIASLARVVGDVQLDAGDGRWEALAAGSIVNPGAVIRTGRDGRAALRMTDGVELRLDVGTRVAFNDASDASLSQGAVYVDSGPDVGVPASNFQLETPVGSVRHLGTQYQARLMEQDLRVGIREGRVEVSGTRGTVLGSAGELLTVGAGGTSRSKLAPTAHEWNWVGDVTPPFSIEGRSVDDFLSWAARETGRKIVYASAVVEQQARTVTLSGTVEGLAPEQAVTAVLSTTSLRPRIEDDQIRIEAIAP